jgi:hypothetical protein
MLCAEVIAQKSTNSIFEAVWEENDRDFQVPIHPFFPGLGGGKLSISEIWTNNMLLKYKTFPFAQSNKSRTCPQNIEDLGLLIDKSLKRWVLSRLWRLCGILAQLCTGHMHSSLMYKTSFSPQLSAGDAGVRKSRTELCDPVHRGRMCYSAQVNWKLHFLVGLGGAA